ncbi:hypothetical protein MKX01_022820 [Papaver californicum]|nr:hypothetical protein MKX01_022820 [Papaver californicum]
MASEKADSSVDTFVQETSDDDNPPSDVFCKSKRVPKSGLLDDRLKTSKSAPDYAKEYGDDGEKGSRKYRKISMLVNEDDDFMGEEELVSDGEIEHKKEVSLTSRQRALMIEFPDGLPPAPTRSDRTSIKKAKEAHRRKTQQEKAARESELLLLNWKLSARGWNDSYKRDIYRNANRKLKKHSYQSITEEQHYRHSQSSKLNLKRRSPRADTSSFP